MGFRPIVIERGNVARERTKDTWRLCRQGIFNRESNAQFGEGSAGIFSDGKLHSGVKDPCRPGQDRGGNPANKVVAIDHWMNCRPASVNRPCYPVSRA
jgi:uncharacterized FAD-dependent dehydrogenase